VRKKRAQLNYCKQLNVYKAMQTQS